VRLALISDIHANLTALDATLADIATQAVDRIVCLGDIVGYNAHPAECVQRIRDGGVLSIAGNHDRAVCNLIGTDDFSATAARSAVWTRARLGPEEFDYLRGLPLKADVAGQLLAVHGALHPQTGCESVRLDNEERRLLSFAALMAHPSGARICAFGHTHRAGVYTFCNGVAAELSEAEISLREDTYYLINPGTVGEPRTRDRRASYMVLDLAAHTVTRRYVDYDAAIPCLAAREAGLVPRFDVARVRRKLGELIGRSR
jgi:predicted phosphodiesterase